MRTLTLGMMIGLVAMTFASHGAAASTCDPTFTVCAGEYAGSYGSCSSGFGYSFGEDYVSAYAPTGDYVFASGFGYNFCYGSYSFSESGVSAGACDFNTFTCAEAAWYGGGDNQGNTFCSTIVYGPVVGFNDLGCPAGNPPNPGWGTLGLP